MNKKDGLNDHWDLDASASDNESYDIEMMLDDSIEVSSQRKDSTEGKPLDKK